MLEIEVKVLSHGVNLHLPAYQSEHAAGMDLYAAVEDDVILKHLDVKLIPTGISIAIPEGYEAQVRPRSGLALKKQVTVLNTPGTVDADYRGEVGVILINLGKEDFVIQRGERIAQLIFNKVEKARWKEVANLQDTNRGSGGFGHTG